MEAALELFSENGYEAVSVGQLAAAVGIKAPSLYKHFSSKQNIFDSLVEWIKQLYENNSLFAMSGGQTQESEYEKICRLSADKIADRIWQQIQLVTSHPLISRTRKLLVIEQYRNPVFCELMENYQYKNILEYNKGLIRFMMDRGILKAGSEEIIALQLVAPVSLELQRMDRGSVSEKEAEERIREHILLFFNLYGKNK